MKALLICPSERPPVTLLAEAAPLVNFPIFGKPLICHWLEHLAQRGATEILILAADRPQQVRTVVEEGARWGVKVQVLPETRELSVSEARAKYRGEAAGWMAEPDDVTLSDCVPGFPEEKLFASYGALMRLLERLFPRAATHQQIGLREISPGIWAGLRTQISPQATLVAPCWISDHVSVGAGAVIGPWAVVERQVLVEEGAIVRHSVIAPETFLGKFTELENSFALGNILINWQSNSSVRITDGFLMSSLSEAPSLSAGVGNWAGRVAAALAMLATSPLALAWVATASMRRGRLLNPRRAVCPGNPGRNHHYYEFSNTGGLWKRWPQLWNVMRGDFAWFGNRPLTPMQASQLESDFERLWLTVPTGLLSLADSVGCWADFTDETRAHSAFYAARANWRTDCSILGQVLKRLFLPSKAWISRTPEAVLKPKTISLTRPVTR